VVWQPDDQPDSQMIFDNDIVKVFAVTVGGSLGTITLTQVNEIAAFILVLVSIAYTLTKLIKLLKRDE
jgi:ABC-type Fe3+-siderophore transport system permease subunit